MSNNTENNLYVFPTIYVIMDKVNNIKKMLTNKIIIDKLWDLTTNIPGNFKFMQKNIYIYIHNCIKSLFNNTAIYQPR